jgi:arylsulfatase A-like enzyme
MKDEPRARAPGATIGNGGRAGAAGLLLALLLFSWWANVKHVVMDWVSAGDDSHTAATPNVLLIVADDLGYNDTSAINPGGLDTPNLAALARQGLTFTRHYADSTCTPSRVGILTGRFPERSGFRPVGAEIPAEYPTIAEQLKRSGYNTYLTGKWHAGEEREVAWPHHKGFDNWFGFLNQWELSGEAEALGRGARKPTYINPMLRENGGQLKRFRGHLTEILTDHTIAKIRELGRRPEPWFLYHAFLAPHHPIQPDTRFRQRFPDTPAGRYAALVTQMDHAIGRILEAVDRENTLVIFVSDNGGTNKQRDNNYPFYGKKSEPYEGAYRTPLIISWPGRVPSGEVTDATVMNVDLYPTIAATAQTPAQTGLDGENLWPLILNGIPPGPRARSWETYSLNVNAMDYSYLPASGDWRLSVTSGFVSELFHLAESPHGGDDVAGQHPDTVRELDRQYWLSHWGYSLLPVQAQPGNTPGQLQYTGFDAMRTPYRNGFAIGVEVGPLPDLEGDTAIAGIALAGQAGSWELRYNPREGLEWHIGGRVLRDAGFDPAQCNPVILTGYLEQMGHLSVREPRSELKLYARGNLQAQERAPEFETSPGTQLEAPTYVNAGGRALFSNMMLSDWRDPYAPRVMPKFLDIYSAVYRERKLSLPTLENMSKMLCNQDV